MTGNNGSVAIVDDERDLVRTYELLFKRRHIPVSFVAYDGHSAIEMFKSAVEKPSLAIIDYRLIDMNGLDVMREVLTIQPDTKIVIISGDNGARKEALDAGANVFLKKPVRLEVITETINSLINS